MTAHRWIALLAAIFACGAVACSPSRVGTMAKPIVLEISPAQSQPFSLTASQYNALTLEQVQWQEVDAGGRAVEGHTVNSGGKATSKPGADFEVNTCEGSIEFIKVDSLGLPWLIGARSEADRAITHFDGPLALAPEQMNPEVPFESECKMRIDWIDGSERERGRGKRSAVLVGPVRVRTPWGAFDAMELKTTFEADLRMARAVHRSSIWFSESTGPLAQEWSEEVRVLGMTIANKGARYVRIAPTINGSDRAGIP